MTEAQARKAGYTLTRGAYRDTTDDRMDRWYLQRTDASSVDRTGGGFRTKADALEHLDWALMHDEADAAETR